MSSNSYNKVWQRYGERTAQLSHLTDQIGYTFAEPALLFEAITHSSAAKEFNRQVGEASDHIPWNERLEFLGDSVLSLSLSSYLLNRHEAFEEGDLSKIRASLVNEAVLAEIATTIGLGECLILGKVEQKAQGKKKKSLLADGLEALFGAIYLDAGFQPASQVIHKLFAGFTGESLASRIQTDYKTLLQEWTQAHFKQTPEYHLIDAKGPSHQVEFAMKVIFRGHMLGSGKGTSKKSASQAAAQNALKAVRKLKDPRVFEHPPEEAKGK